MAKRYDIGLVNGDLSAKQGDMYAMESDTQHIQDTINAFPGWWKENPDDGVGIRAWQKSPASIQAMSKVIRLQLQSDGYQVANPIIKLDPNGDLLINPNATI